jgi:hypothetical protein
VSFLDSFFLSLFYPIVSLLGEKKGNQLYYILSGLILHSRDVFVSFPSSFRTFYCSGKSLRFPLSRSLLSAKEREEKRKEIFVLFDCLFSLLFETFLVGLDD